MKVTVHRAGRWLARVILRLTGNNTSLFIPGVENMNDGFDVMTYLHDGQPVEYRPGDTFHKM